jgi:hypothetical protein
MHEFGKEHKDQLKNYVYGLIDPRDEKPFYIGRGVVNRCYSHLRAAKNEQDRLTEEGEELSAEKGKFKRIFDITREKMSVGVRIYRHGMSEDEAKLVEAVLIRLC